MLLGRILAECQKWIILAKNSQISVILQCRSTILTMNNCTICFELLSTYLNRFQVIECDVYV